MNDLYLVGEQGLINDHLIAVVGTRRMTEYGRQVTTNFVQGLVKAGWSIGSGLARGVDRVAHETCLDSGGKAVAVLAHGLDLCYPPEHLGLKNRIVSAGGLLVSEYPDGIPPTKDQFLARDYLLMKLCRAVLVVESPQKSGVRVTVSAAAEYGKNVYVIPGPITSPTFFGNVEIIRDGGIPVFSPEDLLEQLDFIT